MRSLIVALIVFGSASLLQAQTAIEPERIASAFAGPLTSSSAVLPPTSIAAIKDDHDKVANGIWLASAFAMAAASGLDTASSWGKREENPLLASSNGDFGTKGLAIKVGITAALIVPQIWIRKRHEYRTKLAIANFADAALFTGVAIHNFGIAPPPQN